MPGAGALAAYITAVTGRPPDAMCGKPSELMCDLVRAAGVEPRTSVCIGDRLDTDAALGAALGCGATVLALTGVTSHAEAMRAPGVCVVDSLAALVLGDDEASRVARAAPL